MTNKKPPNKPKADNKLSKELEKSILAFVNKANMDSFNYTKSSKKMEIWTDVDLAYDGGDLLGDYVGESVVMNGEVFTIVQSIMAALMEGDIKFEYAPTHKEQEADTKVLNSLVEFMLAQGDGEIEIIATILEGVKKGDGYTFTGMTNGKLDLRHIPIEDMILDTTNTKPWQSKRYIGYRYLGNKSELNQRGLLDPETGKTQKYYLGLDKVPTVSDKTMDAAVKQQLEEVYKGSTLGDGAKDEQVEMLYLVTGPACKYPNKLIEVANRSKVVHYGDTPFQKKASTVQSVDDEGEGVQVDIPAIEPYNPFAAFTNYKKSSSPLSQGDGEIILDDLRHLNDLTSLKKDNLIISQQRVTIAAPSMDLEEEEIYSGAVLTGYPGDISYLPVQPIGHDIDNEIARTLRTMQRKTAADELIQGASQDKGNLTATETIAQQQQAKARFSLKVKTLEKQYFRDLGKNIHRLIQTNITSEMSFRMLGPKGYEFKNYNPGEFMGEYDPVVKLGITIASETEVQRQQQTELSNIAFQLPFIDQMEVFKELAMKAYGLDEDQVEKFIKQGGEDGGIEQALAEIIGQGGGEGLEGAEGPVPQGMVQGV